MKKILPLMVFLLVGGTALFFALSDKKDTVASTAATAPQQQPDKRSGGNTTGASAGEVSEPSERTRMISDIKQIDPSGQAEDIEEIEPADVKPATEVFKTYDEALKAIKDGALDYNDLVLEQFTQVGDNCAWCDDLYKSLKDLIVAADTTQEAKSYFAEVLAVSGKVENVNYLIESIKNAKNQDEADVFAEALELTVGKDDVVKDLGQNLETQNETLRESVVAALTNQGSRLSADLLYKHTVERGDPDGYYAVGIGLGEFVPDEEAYPVLQEMMSKRDQYSHLAVKALLNSGMNGLKLVMDSLSTSKDPEADRRLLKDAPDHVNYENGLEEYLKESSRNHPNEAAKEFAKKVLEDYAASEEGVTQ